MATYNVDLTPSVRTRNSEGYLDTSVKNGNSIQRTLNCILVVNGTDRKMVGRLADGSTYDDTTFELPVNDIQPGHPTFSQGTPIIVVPNVTEGHPTASQGSGSTI
jgi:hypothetical protein